ncbi:MAG: hypothetical protein ABSC41_08725 [Acidimicrobiales bacterium]|jgi:hypothetical protein
MPTTMSIRRFSRNLLITVVAVATISTSTVALVGPAGASATKDPAAASKAAKHRELARALVSDCVTAHKWLNHESRIEHRFAKRLHRLRVWEADARADGHASRLATLKYDVTHVRALRARALGTTSKSFSRERRLAKAVSPTCAALVRMIRAEKKAGKTHRNEAQAKARAARAAKAAHIEAVAAAKAAAAKAAAAKAAAAKAAAAKAAAAKAAAAKTTGTKAAGTKTTAPPTPPTTTPTTSTTTPTSTTSTSTTTSTTSR